MSIPLPSRKPFREAKLRIDKEGGNSNYDQKLVKLLIEAMAVQRLVLASPQSSLNQLAKQEKRCRTQLARLLRLSWLSPSIVTAILGGNQPTNLNRVRLLSCNFPVDWSDQEILLGFAN